MTRGRYSSDPNRYKTIKQEFRAMKIDEVLEKNPNEEYAPTVWVGVKKLPEHTKSDLIMNFKVPAGNDMGMPPGDYVAFLNYNSEWEKYTGALSLDTRKREPQKQTVKAEECTTKTEPLDIPF
jgi:hypothetical protein